MEARRGEMWSGVGVVAVDGVCAVDAFGPGVAKGSFDFFEVSGVLAQLRWGAAEFALEESQAGVNKGA